jgi:hypothetical protein
MPLTGYTCPAGTPTAGQRNNGIEHCVSPTGCDHKCVAPPLLVSMWNAEHANHHKGSYVSASMLAGDSCARQVYYERFYDFWETPRRRFWPFRGTVIHGLVERSDAQTARLGWLQELRMHVRLEYRDLPAPLFDDDGTWTGDFHSTDHLVIDVGGTTDGLNYLSNELIDFKSLSDTKMPGFFAGRDGGTLSPMLKDSHVRQLNIYGYLVSKTRVSSAAAWFERHGITPPAYEFFRRPERLRLQFITMQEIPLTGTTYVPQRSSAVEIAEVPVLPEAEVEAFIRERALKWYRYLRLGQKPPVVEEDRAWQCKSCPFNGDLIFGERCSPKAERAAAGA